MVEWFLPKTFLIAFEVEADSYEEAQILAAEMAERANDSMDGEVGDVVDRAVEVL